MTSIVGTIIIAVIASYLTTRITLLQFARRAAVQRRQMQGEAQLAARVKAQRMGKKGRRR
jgi:hypothetical protein